MKRYVSILLCFVLILTSASCKNIENVVATEKMIAVEYASSDELVSKYIAQGYTAVEYNASSDVVLAVENKKTDVGILDEFDYNLFLSNNRKIKKIEVCRYNVEYCAYFKNDNGSLQEKFNKALYELKSDGTLEEIISSHLKGESVSVTSNKADNMGTLKMLCDPSFERRIYTNDDGDIVGLDVDIAREICNHLGYRLEIVTADFNELFVKLEQGEGDFVLTACEANSEREANYLASDTYFTLKYFLIEKE